MSQIKFAVQPVMIKYLFVLCFKYTYSMIAISGPFGSTVTLPCQFIEHDRTNVTDKVRWEYVYTKENKTTYSTNEYILPALPDELKTRLNITGNHAVGQYNLVINGLKPSDEGHYNCKWGLNVSKQVLLYIPEPPTSVNVSDLLNGSRIVGKEDQDLVINCSAVGGKPQPKVTLKGRDDNAIYKTGTQSLSFTFPSINRSLDKKELLCLANSSALSSPLTQTAKIYLHLKPFKPMFSKDLVTTENIQESVSCTSTGSRPDGSIYWLLRSTNITANSTQQVTWDSTTDIYTMTSVLSYTVDRVYNGQSLTCGAVNKIFNTGVETTKTINVTFAPDVSVSNVTYYQNTTTRTVTCTAVSNPPVYIYSWKHKSKYGVMIREWNNLQSSVLTLPDVPERDQYQDSGEYDCTASNGVTDKQGNLKQTGSGYVQVNGFPIFLPDNNQTQYGEFGRSTTLHVHVYSVPKYITTIWYKDNTAILNSAKYNMSDTPAILFGEFHEKAVQLDGYRVTLTIHDLNQDDFTNYMVQLTNMVGKVSYSLNLHPEGPPQTPMNFSVTGSSSTSISVQWVPGFNGGYEQTFYIEYRIQQSENWTPSGPIVDHKLPNQMEAYTLHGLQPGTVYELRMYASNVKNLSLPTNNETRATLEEASQLSTGAVIGGVAGGLAAVIVILIIIGFIVFKRGNWTSCGKSRSSSYPEAEDGLKENILYQSHNQEYADFAKNKKKPSTSSSEYADVQNFNAVYAHVDKKEPTNKIITKKHDIEKENIKEAKVKNTRKKKTQGLNNTPESEYANSDIQLDNMLGEKEDKNVPENRNPEGLQYADLSFLDQTQPRGRTPIIHGIENRTIYSDVDLTKKAPNPSAESEYELTNIRPPNHT